MGLATGEAGNPLLPQDEALPQLELLAEMTAAASGEAEDWIMVLVAYQVRVETLQGHLEASQNLAKVAVRANDVAGLDRWSRSVVEYDERLAYYRAKIGSLLAEVFNSNNPEGTAILITALSLRADRGDERAVPMIQSIFDSVAPERAQAICAEYRKLEKGAVQ
jgi:hypothetical protein